MKAFGVQYTAAGYSTPEAVVQGWMNSQGHKANILSTNYSKIGVGFRRRWQHALLLDPVVY